MLDLVGGTDVHRRVPGPDELTQGLACLVFVVVLIPNDREEAIEIGLPVVVGRGCGQGDVVTDPVSIGRALPGQRMEILLENGLALDGAGQGELVISGSQVSRFGYWRTASNRFFDDPKNGRSFRSGDIVRRDDQGLLYWLTRIDDQIKIKGYRVDLGEIEQALSNVDGVRDLICLFDSERQVVIAVYSAGKNSDRGGVDSALRSQAERFLPVYMRPSQFVAVDEVPRTRNGKADRRAAQALVERRVL